MVMRLMRQEGQEHRGLGTTGAEGVGDCGSVGGGATGFSGSLWVLAAA